MTTLEKIRAEIAEFEERIAELPNMADAYAAVWHCLDIIDKYAEQEPCDDVVNRQSAIFLASDLKHDLPDDESIADIVMAHNEGILEYQTQLSLLPSVRPQEQTGHWKRISMDRYTTHAQYWYECDKCGEHNLGNKDFCPNCGARMSDESV